MNDAMALGNAATILNDTDGRRYIIVDFDAVTATLVSEDRNRTVVLPRRNVVAKDR